MSEKKKIFISHITEESELAKLLKEEIKKRTGGTVEVFVSSDGESIEAGREWLESIKTNLLNANMLIALCSKQSVSRSWLSFEVAAGWARGVHVIPACHTNMTLSELNPPISMLQGLSLNTEDGLHQLFRKTAEVIGGDVNIICGREFTDLLDNIKKFEKEYGFIDIASELLRETFNNLPEMKDCILNKETGEKFQAEVTNQGLFNSENSLSKLKEMRILSVEKSGHTFLSDANSYMKKIVDIELLEKFNEIDLSKF